MRTTFAIRVVRGLRCGQEFTIKELNEIMAAYVMCCRYCAVLSVCCSRAVSSQTVLHSYGSAVVNGVCTTLSLCYADLHDSIYLPKIGKADSCTSRFE